MARSKKKRTKKSKPPKAKAKGKKGKQKYGLRTPIKSKRKRSDGTGAAKKKEPKKKAPKKKGTRKKTTKKKSQGPTKADLQWDKNYAYAESLFEADPVSWWVGMTSNDNSFDRWLGTQRYNRKIGRLRADREARLRKIDFAWDTIDATWHLRYDELKRFIKKHGALWWKKVPEADPQLFLWCDSQRRANTHDEISDERRGLLDKIDFVWSPLDRQWEVRFEELREFLKDKPSGRAGKDNAPQSLAFWTLTQRRKWLLGELSPERERRLEEIGFSWDGRQALSDEIWESHFEDLKACHQLTRHANPGPENDEETFRWLLKQRSAWDEIPAERRERLEKLGVSRETPPGQMPSKAPYTFVPNWEKFFQNATAFKKKHGHLRITHDERAAEFPGLAYFAGILRGGSLDPDEEQSQKLDKLGFVWDLRGARREAFFDQRFAELVKFKKKHGHTNVSQLDEKHKALGQWVTRTRQTRDELSDEQRGRLEGIGFVWELKKEWMESQWEIRFGELLDYRKQNGDTLVPQDCPGWYTLSRWVSRMRQTRNDLSKERIARLDEVGFVWNARAAERAATEEAHYGELAAFVKDNGHARVTRGNDPTGGRLNGWIVRQRDKKKKGKIDPELERKLDALGFLWTTR